MAGRLTLVATVLLLAIAGCFAMYRGVTARTMASPADVIAVESSGADGEPSTRVEWRTPQADRQLGPATRLAGGASFHVGLGLAVAAWVMASLLVLGTGGTVGASRWVGLLWLLPAAWGLWVLGTESGPSAVTARDAMETFRTHAPVFGVSLVLGLFFRRGAPPGS